MTDDDFQQYYARRLRNLGITYAADDFVCPHQPPWPEHSFDHPYGQAPTVANVPAQEMADWDEYVARYYTDNVVGTPQHPTPFGIKSAEFSRSMFEKNGISGYAALDDETFRELLTEGLYSKFLGPLDPADEELFGVGNDGQHQYLKADFSCMSLIEEPWPDTYVAPSIAVVRRRLPIDQYTRWEYELVGVALAKRDESGKYVFTKDLVFDPRTHASHSAWWLAKYYVLQGAIHRINLIDHIRVHFPSDTINAITKSVLPQWHLIHQLLVPHFWLTMPVNHAVLEGDRSLINRDTWYPWSPVTASGDEVRKLIPLSWGGASYCWDDASNSAYPRYYFSLDPNSAPDPKQPSRSIPTYVGLQASRFAVFQREYFDPILHFARGVVGTLPEPAANPEQDHVLWLELQRWAHEISKLVPGFPDQHAIRNKDTLAATCAMIIWNASIVHSSDHSSLHVMIDTKPVPFILRVRPPESNATKVEVTIAQALGEKGYAYLHGFLKNVEKMLFPTDGWERNAFDRVLSGLGQLQVTEGSVPLCWPSDLVSTKMTDLMFYRPHGSSLLYDCAYAFLKEPAPPPAAEQPAWRQGAYVGDAQRSELAALRRKFQEELRLVNSRYYAPSGKPVQYGEVKVDDLPCVLNQYGFPKLIPGEDDKKDDAAVRMQCCFSAGIQY